MTTRVVELLDVERRLALFAQAITGSAYEVRSTETFTGDEVIVRHDRAMLSSKALFLPQQIATNVDRQINRACTGYWRCINSATANSARSSFAS